MMSRSEPAGHAAPRGAVTDTDAERLEHALGICMRHLGRRDHSAAELRRRLARAAVDPAIAEQALATLAEQGLVDDVRYAERFTADRRLLDDWGSERIRERLLTAGVDRAIVDAAVEGRAAEDELEAAVSVLRRRISAPPSDDRARARALGLLLRRGFTSELAYEAVRRREREG